MKKTPQKKSSRTLKVTGGTLLFSAATAAFFSLSYISFPDFFPVAYDSGNVVSYVGDETLPEDNTPEVQKDTFIPLRVATPDAVKAIYMTQCVAGTPSFRSDLVELILETEINSVIIDIKDFSGGLGFISDIPELKDSLSTNCYAPDMKEFVKSINEKGIYVIGRITVFQDPLYANKHPELGVKKASATTTLWADYKGLNFIDAGAREYWDYIVTISREAYSIGFDELNYDYIRFPSDGNMQDIYYPFSEKQILRNPDTGKAEVMEEFFAYLHEHLKDTGVVTSADFFGMTTTNTDDLNIGQQMERALPYFDYIAPMVYPSHYPTGFNGWANPNEHIYGVVKYSMDRGVARLIATTTSVKTIGSGLSLSTTTRIFAKEAYSPLKLRPWLQDFDYGGNYDIAEVKAQIQATYDAGLTSWMLWSPSNRYTTGALEKTPVIE